jgi:golgi-specific brefeldin A-resistance guanine nucleotide exchange factor 1
VRQSALSQLSRALLGPLVAPENADTGALFERVLFPLLEELLAAPRGADATEARVRGAALLCKAFMRFEVRDGAGEHGGAGAEALWVHVLDLLAQLVVSDRSDQMVSALFLLVCAV